MVKIIALFIGIVIAAMAGYSYTDIFYGPPKTVLEYGSITTASDQSPGTKIQRRTRKVQRGSDIYWEVETPGGLWLDCAGDCAETYRREEIDLWQTKKEEGR